MQYKIIGNCVIAEDTGNFDLSKTLESGQCFRWKSTDGGTGEQPLIKPFL